MVWVWCGVVCSVVCSVVWCGVMQCGVVWCGVVWVWCGVVCSVVWCGCGVVWRGVYRSHQAVYVWTELREVHESVICDLQMWEREERSIRDGKETGQQYNMNVCARVSK